MKRKLPFRNDLPETCFSVLPSTGQLIIIKKVRVATIPPNGIPVTARKTVTSPAAIMRGATSRTFRKRQCWQVPCSAGTQRAQTRNGSWTTQDM